MEEEKKDIAIEKVEKNYKFIDDKNVTGIIHYRFDHAFHEMHECLKSEGACIEFDDMMKAYDIYLRIIGLGVGNIENPISSLIGHVNCRDISTDISTGKIPSNTYEVLFKSINQLADDDHKFADIDSVINNLHIIFKEFTIFTNDIIDYVFDFANRSKSPNIISIMFECMNKKGDNVSHIIFNLMRDTFGFAIRLSSNIISDSTGESNINILVDTFPEEAQPIIAKLASEDGVNIAKSSNENSSK